MTTNEVMISCWPKEHTPFKSTGLLTHLSCVHTHIMLSCIGHAYDDHIEYMAAHHSLPPSRSLSLSLIISLSLSLSLLLMPYVPIYTIMTLYLFIIIMPEAIVKEDYCSVLNTMSIVAIYSILHKIKCCTEGTITHTHTHTHTYSQ